MTIDRETIGAFVDGELNEIDRRRVEAAIAGDPSLARQVKAERRLRALLRTRFDPVAEQPVPEPLVAAVREGSKVAPLQPRRTWGAPQWAAMAATLVAGIVAGQLFRPDGEVVQRHGSLVASGALARALETQLASAQAPGAPVRIGLSFKARDGAWCRTFEQAALQGIACRTSDGWHLRRTVGAGESATEYRQAASSDVAAAAQEMAAEPPLDPEQERRIVSKGWE